MACSSTAAADFTVKQGETFRQVCSMFDADATPEPITGWTLRCQIRQADGTLVETLTISNRDDTAGTFVIASAGTSAWPVATLYGDILVIKASGDVLPTPTFTIAVERRITTPA